MNRPGDEAEPGFLARWSRLKQESPPDEPGPPDMAPPEEAPADEAAAGAPEGEERTDEEILAALGLKHPDALEPGDDVRGFMQAAVPDRLRRLALRALWRSNPALANLDGLVEYGEDYTDAAMVTGALETVYRVGKGMLPDPDPEPDAGTETEPENPEDPPATAEAEDFGEAAPTTDEPADSRPETPATLGDEAKGAQVEGGAPANAAADFALREDFADEGAPTRRRMVFR